MDLVDYVAALPPVKIADLYQNPFTCLAILRSLPPIAKQYVMKLVLIEKAVSECMFST